MGNRITETPATPQKKKPLRPSPSHAPHPYKGLAFASAQQVNRARNTMEVRKSQDRLDGRRPKAAISYSKKQQNLSSPWLWLLYLRMSWKYTAEQHHHCAARGCTDGRGDKLKTFWLQTHGGHVFHSGASQQTRSVELPRRTHGVPHTASPRPHPNTDCVTGCAKTRLKTATAPLHSEGTIGCGGCNSSSSMCCSTSDGSSTPTRSSLSSIPRMSAVLFDVISFSCGVAGATPREPRCSTRSCKPDSTADTNVLVHGLIQVTVASATLLRGFLQLVTLANAGSAKHFHDAWWRLCKSLAIIDVQVTDRQGQRVRVGVRRHQFARQHVPTIFIESRWCQSIPEPSTVLREVEITAILDQSSSSPKMNQEPHATRHAHGHTRAASSRRFLVASQANRPPIPFR